MRMTVDDLLIEARGVLPHHPGPADLGLRNGCSDRVIAGLRTRQGWARSRWSAQALIRSRPAGQVRPGTADESFEGQQVRGSRISGQAVPGAFGR
jgi:hypothetical protein